MSPGTDSGCLAPPWLPGSGRKTAMSDEPLLLRVPEVARRMNVPVSTVQRLIRSRQLTSVKIGGTRRVTPRAVDQLLRSLEREAQRADPR